MLADRVRKKFRYEGDPQEVTLHMTVGEARVIADGMQHTNYDDSARFEACERLGVQLERWLTETEEV